MEAMADKISSERDRDMMLTSPDGFPFNYSIVIKGSWPGDTPEYSFEVKGKDPETGTEKLAFYHIDERNHNAYLDLFEQLSKDFGLRLPQNRRPAAKPVFKANYTEVLTENLSEGMLYGYGDPAVLKVDEPVTGEVLYYLISTSNDAPDSFPIICSRDLVDWEFVGYVFPKGDKPAWPADGELVSDYWAPEMHKVGDEYWLYFVARDKLTRELCIGMARSQNPEGPFVAAPQPILTANVIDPHVFVKDKDAVFLYWKEDNNDVWPAALNDLLYDHPELIPTLFDGKEEHTTASFILTIWPWARLLEPMERFMVTQVLIETVISGYKEFYEKLGALMATQSSAVQEKIRRVLQNMKTPMFAQQLSVDGSSLIGERTKIIENDLDWEAHLVEGMWVTEHNNKYYLFYAGNDFSTDQYGIGVAVADSPLGPYNKMPKQFLKSTEEWWAPGHPSVVTGPDGTPQLLLHAYFPGKAGYKQFRALLSVPLVFEEDKVSIKPRP